MEATELVHMLVGWKYELCISLCKTGLEIHLPPKSLTVNVPGLRKICTGASSFPPPPPGIIKLSMEEKETDQQRTCQGQGADSHPHSLGPDSAQGVLESHGELSRVTKQGVPGPRGG